MKACDASAGAADAEILLTQAPETLTVGQPVGIELASDDPKSEFQAFGVTPHTIFGHRYFSAVNFTDPKELNSTQFVYAGVPSGYSAALGNVYAPQFSFSNFSTMPQTVSIESYASAGGTAPLSSGGPIVVPAHGSATFSMKSNANASDLQSYIATATGEPGDVIGSLMDEPESGDNRFLIIGKDSSTDLNAGMHPWIADKSHRAILIAFNHTSSKQDVTVRIGTGSGALWQRRLTLQPYQTLKQDINELLASDDNRDEKSNRLPAGLTRGEVSWWTNDSRRVTGRLIQTDTLDDLVENFSCYGQIVLCSIIATATPANGLVSSQYHFTSGLNFCTTNYGGAYQCGGSYSGGGSGAIYSWNIRDAFQNTTSSNYDAYAMSVTEGNGTALVSAESGQCTVTGTAPVSVGNLPDHIIVLADSTNTLSCPNGYTQKKREVDYNTAAANGTQVTQLFKVFETVDPNTTSTCTKSTVQNTASCTDVTNGQFSDFLNAGCPGYNNPGCGFTYPSQAWNACLSGGNKNLGTVGKDTVLSNSITLGQNSSSYPKGTTFPH